MRSCSTCLVVAALTAASLASDGNLRSALAASGPVAGTPILVSAGSPFPNGCGGTNGFTMPGSGLAAEPALAIDPSKPGHVVAAWQQDAVADDVDYATAVGVSDDSGRTFRTTFPPFSACGGNRDYHATALATIAIGPDGVIYAGALGFPATPQSSFNAVEEASRSIDNGHTWSSPTIFGLTLGQAEHGRIVVDLSRRGTAYFVYIENDLLSAIQMMSRTSDAGLTWSKPTPIAVDPAHFPVWMRLAVFPDGSLVDMFERLPQPDATVSLAAQIGGATAAAIPAEAVASRSLDGGRTWSTPVVVARYQFAPQSAGGSGPYIDYNESVFAQGSDDTLYALSEDSATGGYRLLFARSTDRGTTWTVPIVVRSGPSPISLPSVAGGAGGNVAITYDDLRNARPGDMSTPTDAWALLSSDGGAHFAEVHLAGSFDLRSTLTPARDRYFLGDYAGLEPVPGGFMALMPLGRPYARSGPADIFLIRITAAGGPRRADLGASRTHTPGLPLTSAQMSPSPPLLMFAGLALFSGILAATGRTLRRRQGGAAEVNYRRGRPHG